MNTYLIGFSQLQCVTSEDREQKHISPSILEKDRLLKVSRESRRTCSPFAFDPCPHVSSRVVVLPLTDIRCQPAVQIDQSHQTCRTNRVPAIFETGAFLRPLRSLSLLECRVDQSALINRIEWRQPLFESTPINIASRTQPSAEIHLLPFTFRGDLDHSPGNTVRPVISRRLAALTTRAGN